MALHTPAESTVVRCSRHETAHGLQSFGIEMADHRFGKGLLGLERGPSQIAPDHGGPLGLPVKQPIGAQGGQPRAGHPAQRAIQSPGPQQNPVPVCRQHAGGGHRRIRGGQEANRVRQGREGGRIARRAGDHKHFVTGGSVLAQRFRRIFAGAI